MSDGTGESWEWKARNLATTVLWLLRRCDVPNRKARQFRGQIKRYGLWPSPLRDGTEEAQSNDTLDTLAFDDLNPPDCRECDGPCTGRHVG